MERLPQMLDHPTARKDEPSPPWNGRSRHLAPVRQSQDLDFPADFTDVSTRELRLLCNRTYEQLDTDHPALETREQYEALVEELERRERQAERRGTDVAARETFRDNALFSRFELFRDGVMAGYMQYEMRGSHVLLLHSVIDPRFRRMGLEPVLMQAVLLNAHRRRLAVVPYCPEAQNFLAAHPQYLSLIPAAQRRRFARLLASRADHAGHNA
ncbi:MAG: hypothetical protein JWM61_2377 [Micrococcaceae bacterium]|jgi:predicted GNAT family acetyltransferase|nr:hypothetical protein [Micrococcaceae bacterium]